MARESGASSQAKDFKGQTEVLSFELSPAALERYEEPVFRVLPAGLIEPANPVAVEFAARLAPADMERLKAAAEKSTTANRALVDMVDVGPEGKQQNLQVSLMPLRDGGGTLLFVRDLTLDNSLRLALVDSRRRYKDFIEISTDFAWETGADERFAFVPPRGALGYTADGLMAIEPRGLLVADTPGVESPFLTKRRVENEELWLRRPDGRAACVIVSAMPLIARDGKWVGARGVCRDVTETRDREATLTRVRNRERVLTRIVRAFRDEVNPEAMLSVAAEALARGLGAENCHIFRALSDEAPPNPISPGFQLAARYGELEAGEAAPVLKTIGDGAAAVEILLGGMQVLAAPARYQGASNGAVILWRTVERGTWNDDDRLLIGDIANQVGITIEQFTHHEHVLKISRTDALTGLLNRGAFVDGLQRFLARLMRDGGHGVLMYVDLDNFKAVNDTKGHQAGDDALLKVRDILVQYTRPTDLIARLGGDEFALWLNGADLSIAKTRAGQFLTRMKDLGPYSAGPTEPLGMSIGIAVWSRESKETLDRLLARGDAAMYEAKRGGKGSYAVAANAMVQP
ncbi:MAG: diguanylate cyclase [Rhodospirillaceae bacterium]